LIRFPFSLPASSSRWREIPHNVTTRHKKRGKRDAQGNVTKKI